MQYSNFSDKNFYHLLMKFFEEKYTERCTANRTTTYKKFHFGSLLWYHIRSQYWNFMTVIEHLFSQTCFLSHKKWHLENNWNRRLCREKIPIVWDVPYLKLSKGGGENRKIRPGLKKSILGPYKLQIWRNVIHAIFL
jgi:hypothetical protein